MWRAYNTPPEPAAYPFAPPAVGAPAERRPHHYPGHCTCRGMHSPLEADQLNATVVLLTARPDKIVRKSAAQEQRDKRGDYTAMMLRQPARSEPAYSMHEMLGREHFEPAPKSKPARAAGLGLKDRSLHPIGVLAKALKRSPHTVRGWEHKGILPAPAGRLESEYREGRRRMYSTEQIEIAAQIANDEGLLLGNGQVVPINSTRFSSRLKTAWDRLARAQTPGDE